MSISACIDACSASKWSLSCFSATFATSLIDDADRARNQPSSLESAVGNRSQFHVEHILTPILLPLRNPCSLEGFAARDFRQQEKCVASLKAAELASVELLPEERGGEKKLTFP